MRFSFCSSSFLLSLHSLYLLYTVRTIDNIPLLFRNSYPTLNYSAPPTNNI